MEKEEELHEEEEEEVGFRARPENALKSLKKGQRGAEEFFKKKREEKKRRKEEAVMMEKQLKRERREALVAQLEKFKLAPEVQSRMMKTTQIGQERAIAQLQSGVDNKGRIWRQDEEDNEGEGNSEVHKPLPTKSTPSKRAEPGKKIKKRKITQNKHQLISVSNDSGNDNDSDEDESEIPESAPSVVEVETKKPSTVKGKADDPPAQVETKAKSSLKHDKAKKLSKLVETEKSSAKPEAKKTKANVEKKANIEPETDKDEDMTARKIVIPVKRTKEMTEMRSLLPVLSMEQEIMESIETNPVTVVCGETGSGKTTQIPQFLYESGFAHRKIGSSDNTGLIAITQPRRVAAVSSALRVRNEIDGDSQEDNSFVGYKVRYDGHSIWKGTKILFMTDGILLREARDDVLLRKYSVIVLDEAHERNLNTDFIIGILSRIVPLREKLAQEGTMKDVSPLKVVIMSATLRIEDFTMNSRLFASLYQSAKASSLSSDDDGDQKILTQQISPIIKVDARQFPVVSHFSRRTEIRDYLGAVFKKVCAIHQRLPPGGILVFLTGENEIEWFCRKLRTKYRVRKGRYQDDAIEQLKQKDILPVDQGEEDDIDDNDGGEIEHGMPDEIQASIEPPKVEEEEEDVDYSDIDSETGEDSQEEEKEEGSLLDHEKLDQIAKESEDELQRIAESSVNRTLTKAVGGQTLPIQVLPLYSRLPTKKQLLVFRKTDSSKTRLIVVATNVAETSVTIPGIKYVVDCGREKRREFDVKTGISAYRVGWISRASADQRMGRAGRTGPGHCYRLYSAAVYHDHFKLYSDPEIVRRPIEDVVLYAKTLGIHRIRDFPFPTTPDPAALQTALTRLENLGAIEPGEEGGVTPLGNRMAKLPLSPNPSKMLVVASMDPNIYGGGGRSLLPHAIALAAAMSLQSPFLKLQSKDQSEEENETSTVSSTTNNAMTTWQDSQFNSDSVSLLKAVGAFTFTANQGGKRATEKLCRETGLHEQTMEEIMKLRQQLASLIAPMVLSKAASSDDSQVQDLKRFLVAPLRVLTATNESVLLQQLVATGYLDKVARKLQPNEARGVCGGKYPDPGRWPYEVSDLSVPSSTPCFIDSFSFAFSKDSRKLPEYVVFQDIVQVERKRRIATTTTNGEKMQGTSDDKEPEYVSLSAAADDDEGTMGRALHKAAKAKIRQLMRTPKIRAGSDSDSDGEESTKSDEGEFEVLTLHLLRGVSPIKSEWLWSLSNGTSLCDLSAPLEDMPPTYDETRDTIMCSVTPIFGAKRWSLDTIRVSYDELLKRASPQERMSLERGPMGRTNWFARLLLEGKIVPELRELFEIKNLSAPPAHATRMHFQPRVAGLVNALIQHGITSKATLLSCWKKSRKDKGKPLPLQAELSEWIRKEERDEFVKKLRKKA